MLRALWFLIKLVLATGLLIWMAEQKAPVSADILGLQIETTTGFLAFVLFVLLIGWSLVYGLWRGIAAFPKSLRRYRLFQAREKGYRALNQGFLAIASGDPVAAKKNADKAKKLLPQAPLVGLLSAQAAQLSGNVVEARRTFRLLLEDESSKFFGIRGLLQDHIAEHNYAEALGLARQASALQPKRKWILRTLFDLEVRNKDWNAALETLKRAQKLDVFEVNKAARLRQGLYLALSEDLAQQDAKTARKLAAKAFDIDVSFAPGALALGRFLQAENDRKGAIKVLEKAWRAMPNPDIAKLWITLAPPMRKVDGRYDAGRAAYDWIKKLCDLHPEHRDSHRALGHAAIEAGYWKEAREHLVTAGDYRGLARLEQEETGNQARVRAFLEQAGTAPPDACWVCEHCGHVSNTWSAVCGRCEGFSTMNWRLPGSGGGDSGYIEQYGLLAQI